MTEKPPEIKVYGYQVGRFGQAADRCLLGEPSRAVAEPDRYAVINRSRHTDIEMVVIVEVAECCTARVTGRYDCAFRLQFLCRDEMD